MKGKHRMSPTTQTATRDQHPTVAGRYNPRRAEHPLLTDQDVHSRARAHRITLLRRRAESLAAERDETVTLLHIQREYELRTITDELLLEIRGLTAGVQVTQVEDELGVRIVFEGPDDQAVLCAHIGTRNALARAKRRLDEADTAGMDAIVAVLATTDDQIARINAQIAAADYGVAQGGAQ
jgi:hypothetical protein